MESEVLITKYFLNQLSPEEQNRFDALMSTDPDFKEQVIFEQKLKKSIFQDEHTNLKKQLVEIESNLVPRKRKTNWYLMAASIIFLVSIGFYWNHYSSKPEVLYAEYYSVASNTSHPITRNQNNSDELTKAFVAYESEAYDQAQELFNKLFKRTNNSELLFYEGICYLEIGQTDAAIETFINHIDFNDKLLGKSKWYLALAYLKNNSKSEAHVILDEIISVSSNYNYEKAKQLRSDL